MRKIIFTYLYHNFFLSYYHITKNILIRMLCLFLNEFSLIVGHSAIKSWLSRIDYQWVTRWPLESRFDYYAWGQLVSMLLEGRGKGEELGLELCILIKASGRGKGTQRRLVVHMVHMCLYMTCNLDITVTMASHWVHWSEFHDLVPNRRWGVNV